VTVASRSTIASVRRRLRVSEWDPGLAVVLAAAAVFAGVFIFLALRRYEAFSTARFDLGNMVQAIWSAGHGHLFVVTDSSGRQISRLGSHVDPILAAFVPLWWIFPTPKLLLIAQPLIVATGALPTYWIARRWLWDWRTSAACAAAYLLYAPLQWSVVFDFHPVTLATPLLLWCVWAIEARRPVLVAVFATLSVLTKEEVGIAVAGLGLWVLIHHRRTRTALWLIVGGLVWTAICVGIILPHFAPGGASPFISRYGDVGSTSGSIIKSLLIHPGHSLRLLFSTSRLNYLWQLLFPLALLPLLAPLILIAIVPELLLNMLSNDATQYSIYYQYTAVITPFLIVAMIGGIAGARRFAGTQGRFSARPAVVITALLATSLITGFLHGPVPIGKLIPGGSTRQSGQYSVTAHDTAMAHAISMIPAGVPVSASDPAGGRLSDRLHIYTWPVIGDAQWVVVDIANPWLIDNRVKPWINVPYVEALERTGAFDLVYYGYGVDVFRRKTAK
jgi:uncharacterized membrane protein